MSSTTRHLGGKKVSCDGHPGAEESGNKPLVVYITGGGFVSMTSRATWISAPTSPSRLCRASIEYRTVTNGATYRTRSRRESRSATCARTPRRRHRPEQGRGVGTVAGGYLAAMTASPTASRSSKTAATPARAARFSGSSTSFRPSTYRRSRPTSDPAASRRLRGRNSLASSSSGRTRRCRSRTTGRDGLGEPAHLRQKVQPAVPSCCTAAPTNSSRPADPDPAESLAAKGVESTRYVVKGATTAT